MSTDVEKETLDVDDPELSRFDLVREGARRDGVEIVHYEPRFPVPGTREEKRVERTIALFFAITGLAALVFVVAYCVWPADYKPGYNINKWFTPVLGASLGLALLGIGLGVLTWAKKLLPEEVSVQDRHDGGSPGDEKKLTGATIVNMVDETGIKRRPMLKVALGLGLAPVGLAAVVPLGALLTNPHKNGDPLMHTGFDPAANGGRPVRLMHEDGTLVRPEHISVGGQITAFPAIPGGNTNKYADSPTLLIHLRDADGEEMRANTDNKAPWNRGSYWQNYVAYSKICTHAGCPASLYEQQTNRLLCPCHQSQFHITDNARPVFGPATRSLSMLPISVDDEGYFVATGDFRQPIGPGFWERP